MTGQTGRALLAVLAPAVASCTSLLGIGGDYHLETDGGSTVDSTAEGAGGGDGATDGDAGTAGDAAGGSDAEAAVDAFPANPGPVGEVTAGRFHTCIRFLSGFAMCWGRDEDYGELGNGTNVSTQTPAPAMGAGITRLVAGAHDTCALLDGGAVCAGKGGAGELGNGTADADSPVPVAVTAFPAPPTAIASGNAFTCAIVGAGDVYCVGNGASGVLGNGSTAPSLTAVPVSLQGRKASAIAAFNLHACALATDGTVWCWGDDSFGQLGNGSVTPDAGSATPVQAQGIANASAVCVGDSFSCAIIGNDQNSTVSCWGDNSGGQLGNDDGTVTQSATPVQVVGLKGAASIACGSGHVCVGDDYGQAGIWCWGRGGSGQLGNGDTSDALHPVLVSGSSAYPQSLAAGGFHTCAVTSSPNVLCWGANDFGQLGWGTSTGSPAPGAVVGIP